MEDVVIVSAVRTAIGSFGGSLKDVKSPDLAADTMKAAMEKSGIPEIAKQLSDVRFGCCVEDNRFMNVTRIAALRAGIPKEVPAVTINRVCTSAMEAIVSEMVAVPPLLEQHRIVEEIERSFSVANQIERTIDESLKQAGRLRQSILKRAFDGKLVSQNPHDEPAEKLLERIREDRTKQRATARSTKVSKKRVTIQEMRLI